MNGLRRDVDLHNLVGAQVSQVCCAKFQCMLNFDVDIGVSIEGSCDYVSPLGVTTLITSYIRHANLLCELVEARISSTDIDRNGGLSINFENGALLHLRNDNTTAESFQIRIGKSVLVA
jgi:hypothetical protein